MKRSLFVFLIISLLFFSKTFSQAGIYVKFDGISNGSGPSSHNGEFLVTSFETMDTATIQMSGGIPPMVGNFNFGTAKLQKVLVPKFNPVFMRNFSTGTTFKTVTVTWYNSSNTAYYQIILGDAGFQSLSILSPACNSTDCSSLYEEMHLFFSNIQWKDPISGATSGYNVVDQKVF